MNTETLVSLGVGGLLVALVQIGYAAWRDRKSGALHQGQAEAAKASLDVAQAAASLPDVLEALRLGNVSEVVTIQQGMINGLRDHITWAEEQAKGQRERDAEKITELEEKLAARDAKVEELERRLNTAEEHLEEARKIITDLRDTAAGEKEGTAS